MEFESQVQEESYDTRQFDPHAEQGQELTGAVGIIDRSGAAVEPYLGMEFGGVDSAREFYVGYAERLGFRVRTGRFRTSRRDDSMIMRRFVCYKEGFHARKESKLSIAKEERRDRGSLREGCRAMLEVVRNDEGKWIVRKLVLEHTHPLISPMELHKLPNRRRKPPRPLPTSHSEYDWVDGWKFSWGGGEAIALFGYFRKMQARNPAFFYAVQVDGSRNSIANVLWADARSRMAYCYFGDALALDTTYRRCRQMMPFATFTGVNHHLQPVVFACSVLVDESEAGLIWLLESFLIAMCGRLPVSFVTEHDVALGSAVGRVFPGTRHRYGKWQILSQCGEKLPGLCSNPAVKRAFKNELRKCIDDPETVEELRSSWEAILRKYSLEEDPWMQSLYDIRQQWAMVYLRGTFFAEFSPAQRSESMKKFFQRNFGRKTSLMEFLQKFDQAMMVQCEKEVQADQANISTSPVLQTGSLIEKQAAEVYTKTIFSVFQEELVKSSLCACSVGRCEDGINWRYHVIPDDQNATKACTVSFVSAGRGARCSCSKFQFSGVLCGHVLCAFAAAGISMIPDEYILKRWKKIAKTDPVLFEPLNDARIRCQHNISMRSNDLCLDVLKYAAEFATSSEMYNASKMALKQAYMEVLAKKAHMLHQS